MIDRLRAQLNLSSLILLFALIQLCWLLWYYYTGYGGPQELVGQTERTLESVTILNE